MNKIYSSHGSEKKTITSCESNKVLLGFQNGTCLEYLKHVIQIVYVASK